MPTYDRRGRMRPEPMIDNSIGRFAFSETLPGAIRSLEDDELCVLLLALLQEWRGRTELRMAQG